MPTDVLTQNPTSSSHWITPSQAARLLGVSAQWVRVLADQGTIRSERTPLGRLLDVQSVDDLARTRAAVSSDHAVAR